MNKTTNYTSFLALSIHLNWTCLVARMETDCNTDKNLESFQVTLKGSYGMSIENLD